jgi:hypothetical protein
MSRGLGKLQVELLRIIEQDDGLCCTYTLAALVYHPNCEAEPGTRLFLRTQRSRPHSGHCAACSNKGRSPNAAADVVMQVAREMADEDAGVPW